MFDNLNKSSNNMPNRPKYPKRVLITAGMPYGNKDLHFGHIGGVFVHADAFARFMRDRIGKENVIFVSGTDGYGSPIVESYRLAVANGEFYGNIKDFVKLNHTRQMEVLKEYHIDIDLFAVSCLGRSQEIHQEICTGFFKTLYSNKHLVKRNTLQFYDAKVGAYLTGRQVVGQCPIPGCPSEKAYADECSLGHPYEPSNLINPQSTLSGEKPEMRNVTNWYINLETFRDKLDQWVQTQKTIPGFRQFVASNIIEFLAPPTINVKQDQIVLLEIIADKLPSHTRKAEQNKPIYLIFDSLENREKACSMLTEHGVRFRTGKTLVPFRLTGNIEWGLPAPTIEDLND